MVCDADTAKQLGGWSALGHITSISFDEPNLSKARNLGINAASGDLICFIDDDAVAEPTWLARLAAAFDSPAVGAAGGFVRGRNGISYQWKAEHLDEAGFAIPFEITEPYINDSARDRPVKTQGTNAMFRRDILRALHGFDETYAYYMDETDLNYRLWQAGISTAILPDAQVHHAFSASAYRQQNRAPKSLLQIGLSYAYFCTKFGIAPKFLAKMYQTQRNRLIRQMITGALEPRDVTRLLAELTQGFEVAPTAPAPEIQIAKSPDSFKVFQRSKCITPHKSIICSWFRRFEGHQEAARCASDLTPTTLFALSPTSLFHRRWFHDGGYWVQSGGQFGKSDRKGRLFKWYSRSNRVNRELVEIQKYRSQ